MQEEKFSIPGVGAIIERTLAKERHILVQERFKAGAERENGLLEIPAGKIRANESIYDCLRREIFEETGYRTKRILGEAESEIIEVNGYSVLSYEPFSSAQNVADGYPILVQVFICEIEDERESHDDSDESRNIRWMKVDDVRNLLDNHVLFYPMHIGTLRKYCDRIASSAG